MFEVTALGLCGRFETDEDPLLDAVRSFLTWKIVKAHWNAVFILLLGIALVSKSYWEAFNSPLLRGFE